ncbi:MAG: WYL domain-containing protein [Bacteroidales bacterium]|nr:WYL domain-containing protein [Bacteroidales bacterium]
MSKRESIARYSLIIKQLRKKPSGFNEIADYLALESEIQGYDFNISKRTFQRDKSDIRSIFDIDIQYDHTKGAYYIDFDNQSEINERIVEAFDTFNAFNLTARLSNYIDFEKRRPRGTEHLFGLLHAIREKVQIYFDYEKFLDGEIKPRKAEPYGLKEFKNRWYVMAIDLKDQQIKSFALDRMSNLDITRRPFRQEENFNFREHFKYCFGIISPNAAEPEEVILAFDSLNGKYIKSLPLHHTQKILFERENELRISLQVYVTHDFYMELLSFGDKVKVIKPRFLKDKMMTAYRKALEVYQS